jgi:hypothetical protein
VCKKQKEQERERGIIYCANFLIYVLGRASLCSSPIVLIAKYRTFAKRFFSGSPESVCILGFNLIELIAPETNQEKFSVDDQAN